MGYRPGSKLRYAKEKLRVVDKDMVWRSSGMRFSLVEWLVRDRGETSKKALDLSWYMAQLHQEDRTTLRGMMGPVKK